MGGNDAGFYAVLAMIAAAVVVALTVKDRPPIDPLAAGATPASATEPPQAVISWHRSAAAAALALLVYVAATWAAELVAGISGWTHFWAPVIAATMGVFAAEAVCRHWLGRFDGRAPFALLAAFLFFALWGAYHDFNENGFHLRQVDMLAEAVAALVVSYQAFWQREWSLSA